MSKLLSLKEAAECIDISPKKLERLVKKGKLPAYKIGGSYLRFKKEDLESFKETASRNRGFVISNKKNGPSQVKYIFFDAARDFFYFNSFYVIAVIIAIIMIIIILRF